MIVRTIMLVGSVLLLGAAEPAVQPVAVIPPKPTPAQSAEALADVPAIPAQAQPPKPTQVKQAGGDEKQVPSATLSGSDFKAEVLGDNTLILEGSGADLDIIEALLRAMDLDVARPGIEIVKLTNASARDLAQQLQRLADAIVISRKPEDKVTIVADEASNSLMIVAPKRFMDLIVSKAKELDSYSTIHAMETEVIQLTFISASDAAEQLGEMLSKYAKRPGAAKALEQISIIPNDRNRTLIVDAPRESIELIKSLVKLLDVEPEAMARAQLLFIPLLNARAQDLAKSLNDMISAQGTQAKELKEKILRLRFTRVGPDGKLEVLPELDLEKPINIVPEEGTNSLIVATHEANVEPMLAIVKLLDSVPTAPEMGIEFFPLKYADAQAVADVLTELFSKGKELPKVPDKEIKGAVPAGIPGKAMVYNVGIHADTRTNTIVISGRPEQLALAHTVIDQLDVEGALLFPKAKIFYLEHTDAERLANILTQLNEQTVQALEARKAGVAAIDKERALIISDYRSNGLIILATEDKYEHLIELAKKLDSAPSQWVNEIRIITCKNTSAADLADKIEQLWQRKAELRQREDLPQDKPIIVADQRSNALVIASNIEDFDAIKQLVTDLEAQPLAPLAMIRLILVKTNDAGELGSMLKTLFDERMEMRSDGEENKADRVAITNDASTNYLLVAASPENYQEILRIVTELDVIPQLEGVVRTFILENADAANVSEKIKNLFDQGIYKPGAGGEGARAEREEKIAIISDARVNAIMVSASRPNMAIIEQIIQNMESADPTALMGTTQLFKLEHADVLKVADILDQVFQGLERTATDEVFIVPSIIPVEASNALIVAGSRDGITRTKELLRKIDQPSETPTQAFAVYTLKHASGVKLAPKMQQMFEERAAGREGQATPINIQAVEGSNSIIVSASNEDHMVLEGLLELLDVKSNLNQQLRLFSLESADAESTATLLRELFQSQGDGDGLASAIAVQEVPRENAIAVWAAPGQMEDIADMIRKIDTTVPAREMMFDVIQLKQAMAEDLAEALAQSLQGQADGGDEQQSAIISFFEDMADGSQVLRKLIRQNITVFPYIQTNSLLVMAPPDSVDMLRKLIVKLDDIPPITIGIEVFQLVNASSDRMIETLQDIFEGEDGGEGPDAVIGGIAGGLQALPGLRQLSFSQDQRTNSVIVAGNEAYLKLVGELIVKLDGEAAEDIIYTVLPLNYAVAEEAASAIRDFSDQELARLSSLEDVTSPYEIMKRQLTVVSDESSNILLLGYSPRYEDQYLSMLREIDRPPEQVLIEVMLIEVTLDDRFELGVEFAVQDLLFSEKAFLGPNGTVQGPEFDFVLGTDLGAVGSGGGIAFTMTGEDFNFLFHALQSEGRAELISRPSLMVKNNEEGVIEIITQVPVPTQSGADNAGNPITSITYEDAGITLTVTPHINPDGFVQLEIVPEVSSIGASAVVGSISAPTFNRTRLSTTVTVKDGETIIIGGLIETFLSETESYVPWLGEIPYLGALFSADEKTKRSKELLIVITATIVRTEEDAYRISVEQRDQTDIIPDRIKEDPLMKKLQVRPADDAFGDDEREILQKEDEDNDFYGPRASAYGPEIPSRVQPVSYGQKG